MSSKEASLGSREVVQVDTQAKSITVDDATFSFDYVYPGNTLQSAMYDDIGAPLISKAMEGFNGTVFAYGQTGSGKTFTMMGALADADLKGLVPRLTDDLFARVNETSDQVRFLITVSFLEIYNEVIHDLLNPQSDKVLKVREHPDMGIYVEHLCELAVKSPSDIFRLLDQGNRVRRVASTAMNERSSRSHSVFTLKIQQKTVKQIDDIERETELSSKLNLVDLAGSERADKTGAEGATLKEGAAINQSLMALGGVINALAESKPFVPYRNSKLTRLLQESLGGNSATIMVANVSPADYNAEETIGTLRYASRAKKIQNKVVRNEDVHERVIRELQEEIDRLRGELEAAAANKDGPTMLAADEVEARSAELVARLQEMELSKEREWTERERLTAELEEERKNNLNRAVADVMSSVKQEKLALFQRVQELQDERASRVKALGSLKDEYKGLKHDLEAAMNAYEQKQIAHDRLEKTDSRFAASADELLTLLNDIEGKRTTVVGTRQRVGETKNAVQALEQEITATRAELQAVASTIAENDRLRAAIQDEERRAFQSQRDAYLNEQLAAEKLKLEERKKELERKAEEFSDKTTASLETATKRADLLQQELDMVTGERDHLKAQLELAQGDLTYAQGEASKLEDELRDTTDRLNKAEFEVEKERDRAISFEQECWERQERQVDDLRDKLNAKEKEVRALERLALDHKAHLQRERIEQAKEEKARRGINNDAPGRPAVAEAKTPDAATSLVNEKNKRIAQLENDVDKLKTRMRQLERDAKEDSYRVFQGVMDVTTEDRRHLIHERDDLQRLLKQSLTDILHLQHVNDEYKRELDLRRSLDAD